ncbi:SGNH/GDSL hydrolase family protein [Brevundimonas sp.]
MSVRKVINALTLIFVIGIVAGLALTPDGRNWLRHPTLMFGKAQTAAASATPVDAPAVSTETIRPALPTTGGAVDTRTVTPLSRRLSQGPLKIGVFGDSMASDLYTGLYRDMQVYPNVTVGKFTQPATGLARYDFVDIQAKTQGQLANADLDVAIIAFGTNDAQGMEIDGTVHPFGSDGWKEIYGKRVDDLVALLKSRDIAVYWVGMPRMRSDPFNAKMQIINDLVRSRMQAANVPFIDMVPLTADAQGGYEAYGQDANGRRVLMRKDDGMHLSLAGVMHVSGNIVDRLERDAGLTVPRAAPQPAAAQPAA